jgi:hypothetical protein
MLFSRLFEDPSSAETSDNIVLESLCYLFSVGDFDRDVKHKNICSMDDMLRLTLFSEQHNGNYILEM